MEKKYTIRDIAKISGFSLKTVSRVINNEPNVRKSTREKILKVIEETNYKPNLYARNLNKKVTKNILISIRKTEGHHTTQWFETLMSYIIHESRNKEYNIMQEIIYDDLDLKQSVLNQSSGYIDAVVLFYLQENDQRIALAKENGIPVISFEKDEQVSVSVCNNNRKGVREAAEYLIQRGLSRICFLLGSKTTVNLERESALIEYYKEKSLPLEHLEIVYDMNNLERVKQFTKEKIENDQLPEVFFVSGDEKAIAVYHAVYANGLSIPEDVSVIGFDNIPISKYYYPALTTVAQNFSQLAKEMFHLIDRLLEKDENIASIEVDPKLIVRSSVK